MAFTVFDVASQDRERVIRNFLQDESLRGLAHTVRSHVFAHSNTNDRNSCYEFFQTFSSQLSRDLVIAVLILIEAEFVNKHLAGSKPEDDITATRNKVRERLEAARILRPVSRVTLTQAAIKQKMKAGMY